jgi:hypothetical protein
MLEHLCIVLEMKYWVTKLIHRTQSLELWLVCCFVGIWGAFTYSSGRFHWAALLVFVPVFVWATLHFFKRKRGGIVDRSFACIAYGVIGGFLFKSLVDIFFES